MLFNSLEFFPFFLFTAATYFAIPNFQLQVVFLTAMSLLFYGFFNPWYVLLLIGVTVLTWVLAEQMQRAPSHLRKRWMWAGVLIPLAALAYFKYTLFALNNIDALYAYVGAERGWDIAVLALPAGLSFYLFHTISYVIDVYRGAPAAPFTNYSLYVAFFPQLVAGPIVRRSHFMPQIDDPSLRQPDWDKISWGLTLFVFGLFQKIVLADGVFADASNSVFAASSTATKLNFADAWLGAIAFSGQILFDFAGYSASAIGISLCFGYRLPVNFRYPYAAIGFSDFWQRWHISLSSWLRDYLYISLGGNRNGTFATYRNLMITMLLGGLWHGAAWTFVIWGGLHGLYLVIERVLGRFDFVSRIPLIWGWLATLILTIIAWVFFRAESLSSALTMLQAMALPSTSAPKLLALNDALKVITVFAGAICYGLLMRERTFPELWMKLPVVVRIVLLSSTLVLCVVWRGEAREFIYFAF